MKHVVHSVTLDKEKCKGCTNCIKTCPTQAIRVRGGKAKIIKERCIDCGECIRVCPYHAKKAITDPLDMMQQFTYNIALPAPTFYGQFSKLKDINVLLNALIKFGFDDVFEVAYAAQIITRETKKLMESGELEKPVINSACPAVVKLISVRFPNLINNIAPIISPMDLAGKLARERAREKTRLPDEQIGIFFITPCAAKATCAKKPLGMKGSNINGVFSIKDIYLKILPYLSDKETVRQLSKAGFPGVCWANSGGEVAALEAENTIAVDGIHNVIKVMEEIEDEKLKDIDYVEALACTGGCVGGPLNVENNFVAKARVKKLAKTVKCNAFDYIGEVDVMWNDAIPYNPVMNLDPDIMVAMQKMERMAQIYDTLPQLDCGSCGAPSCKALAEDIVRGFARETDCIFKLRQKVASLAREMEELETLAPGVMQENRKPGKKEEEK